MARFFTTATLSLLFLSTCIVDQTMGVNINFLKGLFRRLPPKKILKNIFGKDPTTPGKGGRAGTVFLPTGYFDKQCGGIDQPPGSADICFIIQTSCNTQKSITKAVEDILHVVDGDDKGCPDVNKCGSYTVVTYSNKATNIGQITEKDKKKIKAGKKCDQCKARTDLALEKCKKFFDDQNPSHFQIPDVIVVFNDGVSVETKYNHDARFWTINKALQLQSQDTISSLVIEYPIPAATVLPPYGPGLNPNDPTIEWNVLNFLATIHSIPAGPGSCMLPNFMKLLTVPTEVLNSCSQKEQEEEEACPGLGDPRYGSDFQNPTACCKIDTWYEPHDDGTYTTQRLPNAAPIDRKCPNTTSGDTVIPQQFKIYSHTVCGCITVEDICTGEQHMENRTIKCNKGDLLNIRGANYGRTDSDVCPSINPDENLNDGCTARISATMKVRDLCQDKEECTIGPGLVADLPSEPNGDPCPGTYKYMTVEYECRPDSALCCFADIMLCLDQSNSIRDKDIKKIHTFWHDFIEEQKQILEPSDLDRDDGLQFGVVTYCGSVTTHATLGQYGQSDLMTLFKTRLPKKSCIYTSTHLALRQCKRELLEDPRTRNESRKIIVLATDGRTWKVNARQVCDGPNSCNDTLAAAEDVKDMDVELYIIGEPNHKNRNDGYHREWKFMASDPINCTIINMQNQTPPATYDDLQWAGVHLTKEFCTQGKDHNCTMPEFD